MTLLPLPNISSLHSTMLCLGVASPCVILLCRSITEPGHSIHYPALAQRFVAILCLRVTNHHSVMPKLYATVPRLALPLLYFALIYLRQALALPYQSLLCQAIAQSFWHLCDCFHLHLRNIILDGRYIGIAHINFRSIRNINLNVGFIVMLLAVIRDDCHRYYTAHKQ